MRKSLKVIGGGLLVCLLAFAVLAVGAIVWSGVGDGATWIVDGHVVDPAQLGAGDWLGAAFGIGLALLITAGVLLFVVPLALLLPLGLVALAIAGVLLVVAGVVALVFSPLLLLVGAVWLVVRLTRGQHAGGTSRSRSDGGATIAG